MTIEFHYEADIDWLTPKERHSLATALKKSTHPHDWDYFDMTSKELSIGGSYDSDDCASNEGYPAIEKVLDDFDICWEGGAKHIKESDDDNGEKPYHGLDDWERNTDFRDW